MIKMENVHSERLPIDVRALIVGASRWGRQNLSVDMIIIRTWFIKLW